MINKPAIAKGLASFDSNTLGDSFAAIDRACEIVAFIASAGGAAVAISLYDGQPTVGNKKFFIAANAGESTPFCPAQPMPFKNKLHVVFEQGGQNQGGGELSVVLNS